MVEAAQARGIRQVMINTNGKRLADDDAFLAQVAQLKPSLYFQFDGFARNTYATLRGEPDLLSTKLRALDRVAEAGLSVILVPAVEQGVNLHEVGRIVEFGLTHPAVRGINFQPAFHSGRHPDHDPLQRLTIPDITRAIAEQTGGQFLQSDFLPIPCCFPTCNSVSYAFTNGDGVLPLARLINLENYLDYIANRVLPDQDAIRSALEALWSSAAVPGTASFGADVLQACTVCGITGPQDLGAAGNSLFMILLQDFLDPWTFTQKNVMKCCKAVLLPDGKQIPFCAYNNVGYRELARAQLARRRRGSATPLVFEGGPVQ
ncbi:MAG: hypothetical protein M0Z54_11840 [Thermaerobacter sp.]|nr:hypothetical protein [Thermaerobacter sp.]